jgi:outer membrane immunogenic protein
MKKFVLASAAMIALVAAPARAADISARPVYKTAPVAAPLPYNWTGFYIGGSLGGRWAEPVWTTTCLIPGFSPANPCPTGGLPARLAFNNPASFDSASLRGGIYGGYNWQLNPTWVVGIEGDFGWAKNRKTIAGIPGAEDPAIAGSPGLDTSTVKETWDAGIRGRLGFLV